MVEKASFPEGSFAMSEVPNILGSETAAADLLPSFLPDAAVPVHVVDGYEDLFGELITALDQCQKGKGKQRHANERPFLQQPIMTMSRMMGPGGPAQQVMKKTQEAVGMSSRGEYDRAIAELHGAMVYAAATVLLIRELKAGVK